MAENANMESDAQILWEDVVNMLEADGLAPSTLAMFKSCQAVDIDGNMLVISAGSGFVRRNVEKNATTIKAALERAAFQPMELSVGINRAGAAAQSAIPVTSTAAAPQDRRRRRPPRRRCLRSLPPRRHPSRRRRPPRVSKPPLRARSSSA